MLAQILLILLSAMVLGTALIVLGLRGKRLNRHPICRDCSFDLVAVPEGTVTCPECGAGLKREKAVRIGARRKRPLFLGMGALLVLLPLAPIGTAGYGLLTGQDLNKWKPVGFLLWEARLAGSTGAAPIATELLNRYTAGKLSKDQAAKLVQTALDVQGDHSGPWTTEWADIIEAADSNKELSRDDHARFRKQAPVVEWKARARLAAGGPLPVIVKLKESRVGGASGMISMVSLKGAAIGATKLSRAKPRTGTPWNYYQGAQLGYFYLFGKGSRWGWQQGYGEVAFLLELPKNLPPGRHTVEVTVVTQTKPQSNQQRWSGELPKGKDVNEHTARFDIQVLAEAEPVEKIRPTPELDEKFQLALTPSQTLVWDSGGGGLGGQQTFNVESLPAPVSFDVFWRVGDREWPMGTFTSGRSAGTMEYYYPGADNIRAVNGSVPGFRAKKVDVILRPNEAALATTVDQSRMYDGEIVLEGIEVQRQDTGVSGTSILTAPARSLFRSLFGG